MSCKSLNGVDTPRLTSKAGRVCSEESQFCEGILKRRDHFFVLSAGIDCFKYPAITYMLVEQSLAFTMCVLDSCEGVSLALGTVPSKQTWDRCIHNDFRPTLIPNPTLFPLSGYSVPHFGRSRSKVAKHTISSRSFRSDCCGIDHRQKCDCWRI